MPDLFPASRAERIVFWSAAIISLTIFGLGAWIVIHFVRKYW